ncbi:2Fe-2S iron-sulfur cluster-binding protein [Pseudomonas sp. NFX98]|uniref:2Fe-2S iron-sulfur cluster-binding protein n=1 Tax=Pseudomonas sp. NFX98 TaxID=3399122 RepID=UPI0039FD1930
MARVTFVDHAGRPHEVEADNGDTLMKAAVVNSVQGLAAECGGCLSCATCHAYVDEEWVNRVPAPSHEELAMIQCAVDARPNSRLTCQIIVTHELDGLVLHLPASQY